MRFFLCLIDPGGHGISEDLRRSCEAFPRRRQLAYQWQLIGQVAVLTASDDPHGEALAACEGGHVAVGTVRLDNGAELDQFSQGRGPKLNDLELVLRLVSSHGPGVVPRLLGDFAFVVWDAVARDLVAACDPFQVKSLYYTERHGLLAFASHGQALSNDNRYDVQYLAERVAGTLPTAGLSVYAGVRSVPPASVVVLERGRPKAHRYWSPFDFDADMAWAKAEGDAAATCQRLLTEAVRLRLGNNGDTWAQLSGGMDSSSVVSLTQLLVERGVVNRGLAGTVSFVDTCGTGADEREYSEAVISRWPHHNETIVDPPVWYDPEIAPPGTDRPSLGLVFYPRDCRLLGLLRARGGRVLLTGVGGDNLFTGNMFFFADWLAQGHLLSMVREMARRAAIGRVSFWELGYRNVAIPLLPGFLQRRLVKEDGQMPPWVDAATTRRYRLDARALAPSRCGGRIGNNYRHDLATSVAGIGGTLSYEVIEDSVDVRHPFLYRPLVEFALRLPPELCARPNARKWVLREAMRGILPDVVRTRVGKGMPYGRLSWSLGRQRALLEGLVQDPILGDLGVVEPASLRAWFDAAPRTTDGRGKLHGALQNTLAIEAWLQLRSGRWQRGNPANTS